MLDIGTPPTPLPTSGGKDESTTWHLSAAKPQLSQKMLGLSASAASLLKKKKKDVATLGILAASVSQRQKPETGMLIFRNSVEG